MGWKYVILKNGMYHSPIIFPDRMVHETIAKGIDYWTQVERSSLGLEPITLEPSSAGQIDVLMVQGVGGHSTTLLLPSHPEDQVLINSFPYMHGIR
jgi:hypothetical protein